MKVYSGEVGMIGGGTWSDGGGGGKTILSAFDIGNQHLKRIVLTDYLANYLKPGTQAKILVSQGLSHGFITRPFIAAVEVEGKKYKLDSILLMGILKSILYCAIAFPLFGVIHWVLGLAACAAVVWYYVGDWLQLQHF
jgi:hypothetical protein